jgi:Na+-translocating ferredoxin:NAD+ oxidoreductase RnfC subunit
MEMKELSSILQQNGIVGAGGAGFPTYAKLNENAETIILNCAECEPLLRLHRQLLEKYAREIVETFHMMGQTMGSKDIVIGIKKAYKGAIEALNAVIGDYPGVRLGLLDEVYPAGDEVVLIYEVTGKVVNPGGLPI